MSQASLRILALEPFYGGSHQAFLDGWIAHSQHQFTVLGLPPYKWKWRMRHSAATLARQLRELPYRYDCFDLLWCSDMLNLAEFLGLTDATVRSLPRVAYFHENQLTYPVRVERERDLHFAYSNFTTCLAADSIWFNSHFHQNDFLPALDAYLARMPDFQERESIDTIADKSIVQMPGVDEFSDSAKRKPGPVRIAWNSRWEHDKNPADFFEAMRILKSQGFPFQLIVLGESFRNSPAVFEVAHKEFALESLHWGYAKDTQEYRRLLSQADVVASTANHEFFGISIVEAMAAGAVPLVPDRLAYPEVLANCDLPSSLGPLLYGNGAPELAAIIRRVSSLLEANQVRSEIQNGMSKFLWRVRAVEMDRQLAKLAENHRTESDGSPHC